MTTENIDFNVITLGEWLSEWYEVYKKPYLAATSLRNIEQMIRLHTPAWLKEKKLSTVTAFDVEKALAPLGKSRTRIYARQVLNEAFKQAFLLGIIPRNIIEAVQNIRYKNKKSRALSLEEQRVFLERLEKSRYKWLMLFYLLTGVRRTEALALEWKDVNYIDGVITIHGTKTEESERTIFFNEEIERVLNGQREQNEREKEKRSRGQYHKAPESIVFPFPREETSRQFKKLCPDHHLHELRHTFITRCAENGMNVNVCQQLVGHSTPQMTLNVYTHVMNEFKKKEAKKYRLFPMS